MLCQIVFFFLLPAYPAFTGLELIPFPLWVNGYRSRFRGRMGIPTGALERVASSDLAN